MLTTPMVARCHISPSSSSATDTLNFARSLSFSLRTTWRLSLSDCAPSMRSSSVRCAIGTGQIYRQIKRARLSPRSEQLVRRLSSEFRGDLLHAEGLDHIAHFDVAIICDADSA